MTNTNAREKFLALIKQNGWVNDPHAKINKGYRTEEWVQDPYTFIRLAADGVGKWRIKLDYSVKGSYYSSTGNLLQEVRLFYIPADVQLDKQGRVTNAKYVDTLKNSDRSRYSSTSHLWQALDDENASKPLSIRQRAERLVKNPDLAAWLAAESSHKADVARREEIRLSLIDRELRDRPLPITVEGDEWWNLTYEVKKLSNQLHSADGKTDLPAVIESLKTALANVEAVVRVESAIAV